MHSYSSERLAVSHFLNAVTKHYADFNGRARRREYWMFQLFFLLSMFGLALAGGILGGVVGAGADDPVSGAATAALLATLGYLLPLAALLLPALAVMVRRLHDTGKSGWFAFVNFIPLIGPIWLLVLMCQDGQPGVNQYGPNPKQAGQMAADASA